MKARMQSQDKLRDWRLARVSLVLSIILIVGSLSSGGDVNCFAQAEIQENTSGEVPDKIKQQYRWLFDADFAKVELARMLPELNDSPDKLTAPFKAGSRITFRLLITNISKEGKAILAGNTYKHNRLQLFKGGERLPYRQDVEELVRASDNFRYEDPKFRPLNPEETLTEIIDLNRWYEPLTPGKYKLVVQHRFIWGGNWLEPPPITFEVIQ